ncbi:MAG TPA: hypothetical protein VK474_01720, partial [Chthoniobacterales bacterium]|nr:hypothetical protein [Chthoniobacterales bacterium]
AHLQLAQTTEFAATLQRLFKADPALATLTAEERSRLFALWSERGDVAQLTAFLEAHPEMLAEGWRAMAKARAGRGDFRGAYELTVRFGTRPALPQAKGSRVSIEQMQKAVFSDPNDYQSAFTLYQLQSAAGQADDALITARRFTQQPAAPAYFHFLEAEGWAAQGNWERAWSAWLAFESKGGR